LAAWSTPAVISRCFLAYAVLGLHSLPAGVTLVNLYMDHTGRLFHLVS
jgi:hypothetical protein